MNQTNNYDFTIIKNTPKAKREYGHNYGSEIKHITKNEIRALQNGKLLATEINRW